MQFCLSKPHNVLELGCYGSDFGISWLAGRITTRFDIFVIGLLRNGGMT